jgi:hypothetical protein
MATSLKEDPKEVREVVLDLYLDVKVRSNDEVNTDLSWKYSA